MADVTLDPAVAAGDGRAVAAQDRPSGDGRLPGGDVERPADPRAVRVAVAPSSRLPEEAPIVVGPPPEPIAPLPVTFAGRGVLGGVGTPRGGPIGRGEGSDEALPAFLVDDRPAPVRLRRRGPGRALLVVGDGGEAVRRRVVFPDLPQRGPGGLTRREVVVDGWRIEVDIEPERRAALRERARRGREAAAHGGPTEVHAIIPGRVISVSVVPGDEVTAGQQVLVVEAMKMQNELRAPRDGVVKQVGVAAGRNIEVGDLLLIIE